MLCLWLLIQFNQSHSGNKYIYPLGLVALGTFLDFRGKEQKTTNSGIHMLCLWLLMQFNQSHSGNKTFKL